MNSPDERYEMNAAEKLAAMLNPDSGVTADGGPQAAIVKSDIPMRTSESGRGPTGRLRNFKQMSDKKFAVALAAILDEDDDPEAIEAILAESARRSQ